MRTIAVNQKRFRVQENLWDFLNTARCKGNSSQSRYAGVLWWIDAICINQRDLGEKTQQVRMMGKIYEEAGYVFLWISMLQYTKSNNPRKRRYSSDYI